MTYFPKVAGARCVLTPKVSQNFTPNAHQVLLLKAPPLGGRATTPMVLAEEATGRRGGQPATEKG